MNRKLTVCYKRKKRKSGYNPQKISHLIPSISLNGIWLENAGFNIGDNVFIEVYKNSLLISKENEHKFKFMGRSSPPSIRKQQ